MWRTYDFLCLRPIACGLVNAVRLLLYFIRASPVRCPFVTRSARPSLLASGQWVSGETCLLKDRAYFGDCFSRCREASQEIESGALAPADRCKIAQQNGCSG